MSAAATLPREERLRHIAGLRGHPALALSAWRGFSGRRYVVGIHPVGSFDLDDMDKAVLIAVRRDGSGFQSGIAQAVRVAACADGDAVRSFLAALPKAVTEVHVHRLAESAAERAAIVADLNDGGRS